MSVERTEAVTAAPDFLSRRAGLFCAALLALMGAQMLSVIRQKSITVDEWVLIPAGFYHLTGGDYRPVHEHPPVAKVLGAAPLVALGALILAGATPDVWWVNATGLASLWAAAILTGVTGWDYLRIGLKHMD